MGSNPTRAALFFFLEKKELFGLAALPFFLFIGLRVSCDYSTWSVMSLVVELPRSTP